MKQFITTIAREAGELALKHLGTSKISSKGEKNPVTEADKAVEKLIIIKIKSKFPEHNIIAEESGNNEKKSDFTWFIDPIDGTSNYSHGDPNFCISIALAEKDMLKYACIYIPMLKEMYFAEKGKGAELNNERIHVSKIKELDKAFIQMGISPYKELIDDSLKFFKHFTLNADRARDYGFCAGQLAYVAAGRAEALIKKDQHAWDVAAGILLIEEAGGLVTDEHGKKINIQNLTKSYLVASNKIIHDNLLEQIQRVRMKELKQNFVY